MSTLSDAEFKGFARLLLAVAGIQLSQAKKLLISGRLASRLAERGLQSHSDYLDLIAHDAAERQAALDLLTATDTQFFREPRHFSFLAEHIAPRLREQGAVRVWSAACASGEEAWTLAMVLLNALGHDRFEIIASDLNTRELEVARQGRYPIEAARDIPWAFRSSYCQKGEGPDAGHFLMDRPVRERVRFEHINLHAPLPDIGQFDVIFLRNVLSAFSPDARLALIQRVLPHLKPDGWLFIGEAETLPGLHGLNLKMIRTAIYAPPPGGAAGGPA